MSASSKKKLRNEQNAAKMTERQLAEQKEAKKLKTYTTLFIVVLAVIVIVAAIFAVSQFISNSGIREKNTVAAIVGDEEMSNAELNYYYVDAVNQFYSTYGSYASLFGLDVSVPLNEQILDEEAGTTWADDFVTSALANAKSTYALATEAKANGYELTADDQTSIESTIGNLELYAMVYGFADGDAYVQAIYGKGASLDSYREYLELNTLASSYYAAHSESLTYDNAALRAFEEGRESEYSAFSYNYYYLNVNAFLEGGTADAEGVVTYSDEEKAAAVAAAEAAAKELVAAEINSVEKLNEAIAALSINADAVTTPSSSACTDYSYSSITSLLRDWVTDSSRKAGDLDYVVNSTTATGEDGTETTTVNGYYVVYYVGSNDNNYPLANVRHILIAPEGGTTDSNGVTTYSEEEKLAAKMTAEELLAQWESGKASEETFAALANENSTDTGSNTNGGLYEDVYPGQMVANFNNWCFAEGRKAGDTGIVETDYGYHIMYYVGDSETLYRDYLVENDLRESELTEWYNALVEAMEVTEQDTKYLSKDLVIAAG